MLLPLLAAIAHAVQIPLGQGPADSGHHEQSTPEGSALQRAKVVQRNGSANQRPSQRGPEGRLETNATGGPTTEYGWPETIHEPEEFAERVGISELRAGKAQDWQRRSPLLCHEDRGGIFGSQIAARRGTTKTPQPKDGPA